VVSSYKISLKKRKFFFAPENKNEKQIPAAWPYI